MIKLGLVGEHLGHSYSPKIHKLLHGESYELFELSPEALAPFFQSEKADGVNVTIPYKGAVMPLCKTLSPEAQKIGSVNTMVRKNGVWHGHNTDYYGFAFMVNLSGVSVSGKKAVIFGSGGASKAVIAALEGFGASEVVVVSRSGKNNYDNLALHKDARIAVNATPVGMYPNNGVSPADLSIFSCLEAAFDLVYNPSQTAFVLQAKSLGIPAFSGLPMLVAQAAKSAELFLDREFSESVILGITKKLEAEMKNIVLIGMPGCGKTTIGTKLAEKLNREFFDADLVLEKTFGKGIPQIFDEIGEAGFRKLETETLRELGKKSAAVIATGGGCVTRPENFNLLRQNSTIIWITRDLNSLDKAGRPISQATKVSDLWEARRDLYELFSDFRVENLEIEKNIVDGIVENSKIVEDIVEKLENVDKIVEKYCRIIMEKLYENSCD